MRLKKEVEMSLPGTSAAIQTSQTQGPLAYLALHTLGWKAFQDLCAQICEEVLKQVVSIYREAQDGGQDAVFLVHSMDPKGKSLTGTVQCKFTSDPHRRLHLGDFTSEKKSIKELVSKAQAHSYLFITNMSVDAPVAGDICKILQDLGVIEPYVFGREWITSEIRKSSRLRALVPRVYGLGDLSTILDERLADQTKALLGHLLPSLGVYVPTTAHRSAVRVLSECGIVLLLGPPASGKSMLASILATTALNADGHRCFQVDGPIDLMTHWNPHESGGFYWIDDAFGPNQLRMDYVDHWLAIMNKVQAAVASGNRFVLTSRSHIWKAAKAKFGTRNHPLLENGKAIVELSGLSPDEGAQILYNHIKSGNQTKQWKNWIKPYVEQIASESSFLPEIARRLGNQAYTSKINNLPNDLLAFIWKPTEFLRMTIDELGDPQKAALTLIFLHRSKLMAGILADGSWTLVGDKFGVSQVQIGQALEELNGTFVVKKSTDNSVFWSFFHPTITDALSTFLRQRSDLTELYLRGAKVQEILSEVVCEGCQPIKDALIVPNSVDELLISRILETPNEQNLNQSLFSFLYERASDSVFRGILEQNPDLIGRESTRYWKAYIDPKVCTYARAHDLGVLKDCLRLEMVDRLEKAVFERFDSSVLENDQILGLFYPIHIIKLVSRLSGEFLESLSDQVETVVDNADYDIDPEDNFDDMRSMLNSMRDIFPNHGSIQEKLDEIEGDIDAGIEQISASKDDSTVEWEGEDVAPKKETASSKSRSIFSDVDQ